MQSNSLAGHLGIEIVAMGPEFITGTMPVDERTVQPFGLLHGGASIVLAETLGSIGSFLLVSKTKGTRVAGIEVSGSHLRSATSGLVTAVCQPSKIGRSLHFWNIEIRDEFQQVCCSARLTVNISRLAGDTGDS